MDADKGWRWDSPEAAPTLAIREPDRQHAEGRSTIRTAAVEEAVVHDFAVEAAAAVDVESIRRSLASAARWASGEASVSLTWRASNGVIEALPSDAGVVLIQAGDSRTVWGWLDLRWNPQEPTAARSFIIRRRLETLATLAAFAIERVHAQTAVMASGDSTDPSWDPAGRSEPPLHDATLLSAVLPFAINQARRHKEPLSVLCIEIDRLRGVRELLGVEEANRVVERVGGRIAGTLRSSDLVGRLDDDRLLAILPRAALEDAAQVGEKLCRAVCRDENLLNIPLTVSLSIGAASCPSDGTTLGGILVAADLALAEARQGGPGRVATAPNSRRVRVSAWA